MDDPTNREKDDSSEETSVFSDIAASPLSPPEPPHKHREDQDTTSHLNTNRIKSRVKRSSRRMFLDSSFSDEEEADDRGKTVSAAVFNHFFKNSCGANRSEESEKRGNEGAITEQDSSLIPQSPSSDDSWMCPLKFDELSPSPSDTETQEQSPEKSKSLVSSNSCSGMILKLRRMFSEGLNRKKARYQAVSDLRAFADDPLPQTEDLVGEVSDERELHRRTPKVTHKWQRTGSFPHALRPLGSSSKRKRRPLLKIKYCPYLSACHSAEHRRRWVLRSAVQRARGSMRLYYPDLVGKRIRHLYEEDDKSEVWYRGEVLRIHEAHANPLKTIFEVRYDSEPEWKYYLELLIDFKKGWLKIED